MTAMTATHARASLYRLIEALQTGQKPVLITGKKGNAVLMSEEDWRDIEETMYLMSIPGMRDSILEGMHDPISKGSTKIEL